MRATADNLSIQLKQNKRLSPMKPRFCANRREFQPLCKRTVGCVLADDNNLLVVNVCLDDWQNIRVTACCNPKACFSFDCFDANFFVVRYLERDLSSHQRRTIFSKPHNAETPRPSLSIKVYGPMRSSLRGIEQQRTQSTEDCS